MSSSLCSLPCWWLCSWWFLKESPTTPAASPTTTITHLYLWRMKPLEAPKQQSCAAFPAALTELNIVFWKPQKQCSSFSLWSCMVTEAPPQACIQKPVGDWPCKLPQGVRNVWSLPTDTTSVLHVQDSASRLCWWMKWTTQIFFLCQDVLRVWSAAAVGSSHYWGSQNVKVKWKSMYPTSHT